MNRNKMRSMWKDLLVEGDLNAQTEYVHELIDKLWEAHQELPRTDPQAWTVEFSTVKELDITIRASLDKGHPGSYWEPPEPASIDDMEILIEGCGITSQLFNKLTKKYEADLDELVWEEAEAMEQDYLEAQAEHRMAAAEARRDLEEGR